ARNNGMGSTNITIANNIVIGGGPAASIVGPAVNYTWQGNMIFKTKGAGDMPAGSFVNTDPKVTKDADGEYHLQKGSPAIDAATGSYTGVGTDMDAQTRVSPLDIGADEVSAAPVSARVLKPADVGHLAAK
ncbi:MAG: hypothetical protein JST39_13810, partial [Bacteroidetes bacterium]|nr:hypothetical protein [Bacteroidota bacterium]